MTASTVSTASGVPAMPVMPAAERTHRHVPDQGSHHRPQVDPLAALRTPQDPPWDVYLTGTVFLDVVFTGLDSAPVRGTESWARGDGVEPGRRGEHGDRAGPPRAAHLAGRGLRRRPLRRLLLGRPRTGRGHRPEPLAHRARLALAGDGLDGVRGRAHDGLPRPRAAAGGTVPRLPAPRAGRRRLPHTRRPRPWIAQAAARGTRVFADVGWDDTGAWDLAGLPDLAHCEAFLPNAEEAMRYTGATCPRAAAHALTEHVPLAVVTLGADGAYAVDRRTGRAPRSRPSRSRPWTRPAPGTSSSPDSSPAPWPAGRWPTAWPSPV